ncbi:MAG TPA: arginase family protein, partial [Prolixibacteraceae bacterium]|nr:arginase family protein [Prolixibacteraceae bacterium]
MPTAGAGEVKVALVGVPHVGEGQPLGWAQAPAALRRHLYGLSHFGESTGVVDLGDLRAGKGPRDLLFALRDVTDTLTGEGITVVFLGGGQDQSIGICRTFRERPDFVLSVIDARVDVKAGREVTGPGNFLTRVLKENPSLFHLQVMGTQAPLVPPAVNRFLDDLTFDLLSLGSLRDDFSAAEPLLRHTTFLSFDLGAVKGSETGSPAGSPPNGLHSEEACRLARYAGLSPALEVFGLFGLNPANDPTGLAQALGAQIIWYFLEAMTQRRR